MSFNRVLSSTDTASAGAMLELDGSNPVHLLYAGAAIVAGATVVTAVGVTTIAAPGLVIAPVCAATAMAIGGSIMNDRRAAAANGNDAPASPVVDTTIASA